MNCETTYPPLLSCEEMLDLQVTVSDWLVELEEALGIEAVWKLTSARGGLSIFIPRSENAQVNRNLQKEVGRDVVLWLYERFNWGGLLIPMGPFSKRSIMLALTRKYFNEGLSHSEIAKKCGCHLRTTERAIRTLYEAQYITYENRIRK